MDSLHTKSPSYCEPFLRSGTTQSKIATNLGRLFSTMPASYLHIYVFIHFFEIIITMMFFCPTHQKCDCGNACTESPSPEQTQKMNHRLRDTLQKEKLTTRFRCYCGLKMEKKVNGKIMNGKILYLLREVVRSRQGSTGKGL